MKLTITPVQYVENGRWFVEACLDINEILNDKKLVKYFIGEITEDTVNMRFRDDFVPLNDFVKLLKKNKSLYNEYKGFVDWAKGEQEFMQKLAINVHELCTMIKKNGKDTKKYMRKNMSKKVLDYVDYLCDRNAKENLKLNEMCSLTWEHVTNGYVPQPYED